jgi:hypothetical protein
MQIKAVNTVATGSITVEVHQANDVLSFGFAGCDADLRPIFFRRRQYLLPSVVVDTPMPTLTCRHLEKALLHLLDGKSKQTLLAFKRAVVSAIDPASLIKVALACHAEACDEEAMAALDRARKFASGDAGMTALVDQIASHLDHAIAS